MLKIEHLTKKRRAHAGCAAFSLCQGKRDADLRALPHLAFELDGAVVILHGVLHDGQAQSRAAGGLGVALVHPVEPLEHAALVLRWDADAGVTHRYGGGRKQFFKWKCSVTSSTFSLTERVKRFASYIKEKTAATV